MNKTLAAGALVWRPVGRSLEVLLVHRPRHRDWSWPKGKLEPGEALATCAAREVAEETGIPVILGQPLPKVCYRLGDGSRKEVHYWAATPAPEDHAALRAREPVRPATHHEVDEANWVEATTAMKLLTYAHDREPLGALLDLWHDERLRSRALLVVRHSRARKRSAWKGGEVTRPLTVRGQRQAASLVPLLAAFGVAEVVTSPWSRCRTTVEPYAEAAGVTPVERPELTEDAHDRRPKRARTIMIDLLTRSTQNSVLCTHRPVLPTVMDAVSRFTPHRIMRMVPESDPWLRTGEVLVVHTARRPGRSTRVVALEKVLASPGAR